MDSEKSLFQTTCLNNSYHTKSLHQHLRKRNHGGGRLLLLATASNTLPEADGTACALLLPRFSPSNSVITQMQLRNFLQQMPDLASKSVKLVVWHRFPTLTLWHRVQLSEDDLYHPENLFWQSHASGKESYFTNVAINQRSPPRALFSLW